MVPANLVKILFAINYGVWARLSVKGPVQSSLSTGGQTVVPDEPIIYRRFQKSDNTTGLHTSFGLGHIFVAAKESEQTAVGIINIFAPYDEKNVPEHKELIEFVRSKISKKAKEAMICYIYNLSFLEEWRQRVSAKLLKTALKGVKKDLPKMKAVFTLVKNDDEWEKEFHEKNGFKAYDAGDLVGQGSTIYVYKY
ncbi:hypothetical protein FOL47_004915 [Perkinsus chesapeaki]|uniref:N-acetyltransferase domain-containing protein n=1 Tax=Perkinsus chesapeaki TaxID=330153 RepID=A0A7J6M0V4_PERCH|nr:hypothetical protein FOL47_004915 [Perkinsus chesapeaki]